MLGSESTKERVKHDLSSHTKKHSRERFTTIEKEKKAMDVGSGSQPQVANTDQKLDLTGMDEQPPPIQVQLQVHTSGKLGLRR